MKSLNLVIASSLALLLAGCSDDSGDEGADSANDDSGATTMATTGDPTDDPSDGSGDPSGTTTTGDPPDDTTGDPPDDTTGEPETTGPPGVFETEVYPIIMANCSCHVGGGSGMLPMPDAMTAYSNLVGVAATGGASGLNRVEPGSVDDSYLWAKLNGDQAAVGGAGSQMPLMAAPLEAEPLGVIEQWILDGAPQ